jgi:DNA-binding CsgD family transcriptional regulator
MAKSSALRAQDVRTLYRLVGECRDLGDEQAAWRAHLVESLSGLVDAEGGFAGEMGGCQSLDLRDLGVVSWWEPGLARNQELDAKTAELVRDPRNWPSQRAYHRLNARSGGTCLSRLDFLEDRDWYGSLDFEWINRILGVDNRLWCFRPIGSGAADEHIGIVLTRVAGRRDFRLRDRTLVREVQAMLAPLVGGPLARFAEPSASELPPRVRQVLVCLLEGDGDKQIARRLRLSTYTVNQYTKMIYHHFRVDGRVGLLARWVRRGWRYPGGEGPAIEDSRG